MNRLKDTFTFGFASAVVLLFITAMATWRVYMSSFAGEITMANFSPIGAMALFGGVYFSRSKALIFPLLTLWLSDIMLNRFLYFGEWIFFYDGFLWVYGAFALMVFAGRWMKPNKGVGRFVGTAVVIVFIHWIVTDIGVWLSSPIYPLTGEGLWFCLVAAIPFELNFLTGTLTYGAVKFGLFEGSARWVPSLKISETN